MGPRGHSRAGARQRARGEKAPSGSALAPPPPVLVETWRLFLRTGRRERVGSDVPELVRDSEESPEKGAHGV